MFCEWVIVDNSLCASGMSVGCSPHGVRHSTAWVGVSLSIHYACTQCIVGRESFEITIIKTMFSKDIAQNSQHSVTLCARIPWIFSWEQKGLVLMECLQRSAGFLWEDMVPWYVIHTEEPVSRGHPWDRQDGCYGEVTWLQLMYKGSWWFSLWRKLLIQQKLLAVVMQLNTVITGCRWAFSLGKGAEK